MTETRPITKEQAASLAPLVARQGTLEAELRGIRAGISASLSLIWGGPTEGSRLLCDLDAMTLTRELTPEQVETRLKEVTSADSRRAETVQETVD